MDEHGWGRGAPDYARRRLGATREEPPVRDLKTLALWAEGWLCRHLQDFPVDPVPMTGVDAMLAQPAFAGPVVVQLPPVWALSNRYYRVHGRRNDRFICPTTALRALYPALDFTDFAFVGHLFGALTGAERDAVTGELRHSWSERMTRLEERCPRAILVHLPRADAASELLTPSMIAALSRPVLEVSADDPPQMIWQQIEAALARS